MTCSKCGYDDLGTGDFAHACEAPAASSDRPASSGALRPCPFCGSEPDGPHPADASWWIECARCEVDIERVSKSEVIEAWNRRA